MRKPGAKNIVIQPQYPLFMRQVTRVSQKMFALLSHIKLAEFTGIQVTKSMYTAPFAATTSMGSSPPIRRRVAIPEDTATLFERILS